MIVRHYADNSAWLDRLHFAQYMKENQCPRIVPDDRGPMVKAIAVAAIAREQISAHADGQLAKVSPLGGAVEDQIESPVVGRRVGSTTKRPGATYSAHMTARRSLKRSPAKSLIEELQQRCARSQKSWRCESLDTWLLLAC